LVQDVYRKDEWFVNALTGERDLSGNPPYRQCDILPIKSPQATFNRYSRLVFLPAAGELGQALELVLPTPMPDPIAPQARSLHLV
jgi:hypothetical protein